MMLYIGNGCVDADKEIFNFVNKTNCLVSTTFSAKGIFPEDHANWFWCGVSSGVPNELLCLLDKVDLLIIVGNKMGELSTGHFRIDSFKKVYYIDIDNDNFNNNYDSINLKMDANIFFKELNNTTLYSKNNLIDENTIIHSNINKKELQFNSNKILPYKLVRKIQSIFPDNTIYSCDSGNSTLVSIECLRLKNKKCFTM